jgi:dTDP-4-amino-4,6-dideoxygalactose transaminase
MTGPSQSIVPFAPPQIGDAEMAEVAAALASGWLSSGPRVRQFEAAFAAYTGAPHAVAVNSCTAALHLSLLAAGIGPGDEVITTPFTFCATVNAIVHCGAVPVFADIDPGTGNLDSAAVQAALSRRTRAIVPVHYAGRPVDVDALTALARARQLTIVEDAAHAVEAIANGRKIGTTADFTCFSFYATKNLTTGEGGMVVTGDGQAARRMRALSLHGMTETAWTRYERLGPAQYELLAPGFKYNMSDLQAAIGIHQLAALEDRLTRREAIWTRYDAAFADLPFDRFRPLPPGTRHARHLYTIIVGNDAGFSRDALARALADRGIASSIHFPVVHLHRYYAERFGFRRGQYRHAESLADRVLSLPFSAALDDAQIDRVIAAVRQACGARRAA